LKFYNSEKDYKNAKRIINEAYNHYPNSEQILFRYAKLVDENKEDKLALLLIKRLIEKFPNKSFYYGYLGNAYFDLQLNNAALASYQKAKDLSNSKEAWILENIGNLLKNQGFFTEGALYLKEALKLSSSSEYSHNRLSICIKSEEEEQKKISEIIKEAMKELHEYNESQKPSLTILNIHNNTVLGESKLTDSTYIDIITEK